MSNIDTLLTRRVEKILPSKEEFKKLLDSGKKIQLYQGFDATGSRLHLGHTIGLRKLMDFANAGHKVIFLFGTGTVLVGDPSERETGRKLITQEEIDENIKNWRRQVAPIVDFEKITIKYNGDWLVPLTLKDIISIASNISAVQLFKRESFTRRISKGDTVWYHETLYPLLQGYDSVVMDVDLEIGGTDQEFNMLVGRELQKKMNHRDKFVLTTPMILGTDGKQMSKSSGNCVWLDDNHTDMFGKLMSIPDQQIVTYLENLTNISLEEITNLTQDPLNNKKKLAFDITSQFHGKQKAREAQQYFESTVQKKELPKEIPSLFINKAELINTQEQLPIVEIGKRAGLSMSVSQLKRTIEQGGVEYDSQRIINPVTLVKIKEGAIIKFGKRDYRQIKIHD